MITPTYISEADLTVRIQTIQCCLSDKANKIASDMAKGISCKSELKKLEFASIALDIIKCTVTDLTIYNTVILEPFILGDILNLEYSELRIVIASESIDFSLSNIEPEDFLIAFTAAYPQYSYTRTSFSRVILNFKITGPCNVGLENCIITSTLGEEVDPRTYTFSECIKDTIEYSNQNEANCLTVKQLDNILQYLANYCGSCFLEYGQYDNL